MDLQPEPAADEEPKTVTQSLRASVKQFIEYLDENLAVMSSDPKSLTRVRLETWKAEAQQAYDLSANPPDWTKCPECGSDQIVGDGVEIEDGDALQTMDCADCGAHWGEWYRGDERVIYEHGIKPRA